MTDNTPREALDLAIGAFADIAFSSDMSLEVARNKAKRIYEEARAALAAHVVEAAQTERRQMADPQDGMQFWLWKNGDHFLAFTHLYPCFTPGGDPMVLGEPVGRAVFKRSFDRAKQGVCEEGCDARPPAVEAEPVANWCDDAAKWLRRKADEQASINEAYPDHVLTCPSWRHRVFDRRWLAEELDAMAAGAESWAYNPGHDMARTAIADGTCAPVFAAPLQQPQEGWVSVPNRAARDVLNERARQITKEGWSEEHDDEHFDGELATAAACYADSAKYGLKATVVPAAWPWAFEWWKPAEQRRMLVKAGALILAEIERLDRIAAAPSQGEGATNA